MPPQKNKQAARKEQKQAGKKEDEAPVGDAASKESILAAGKELFANSVLLEMGKQVPQLVKKSEKSENGKSNGKEKNADDGEEKEQTDETTQEPTTPGTDGSQDSVMLEGLTRRLSYKNPLGIDKAPEENWGFLMSQEVDFGPHKRKKGTPVLDRILTNFETNLAPYLHILLFLLCARALLLRSWFACLPWLVGYQFLSLYVPLDLVGENIPHEKAKEKAKGVLAKVEDKHRVLATMCFHFLVWLFLLYEFTFMTYIFEKLLLMAVFVGHAYVVAPVDLVAARKAAAEKSKDDDDDAPPVANGSSAADTINKVKANLKGLTLAKHTQKLPGMVKDIQASVKKEKTEEKDGASEKTEGDDETFDTIKNELTPFNMLGLAPPEDAKESWKAFGGRATKFAPVDNKKKGAAKARIMTNLDANMFQYVNILLFLMCLRALLFRSWFSFLPLLVVSQFLSLQLPAQKVQSTVRSVISLGVHMFVWFFFVYEAVFRTNIVEKLFLAGLFLGHAYLTSPTAEA
jgi:hypothetical protein